MVSEGKYLSSHLKAGVIAAVFPSLRDWRFSWLKEKKKSRPDFVYVKKSKHCPWNGFFSCLVGILGLIFTTWGSEVRTQRFKHRKIGYQCQLCWVGRKQFLYAKGKKKKKERLFSSSSSSKGLYKNELEEVLTFIISCNQIWASYLLHFFKTTLEVTVHAHTILVCTNP